ncbi:MAG: hypothetical protein ACOC80_06045 [Petrotogales bacterium]
MSSQLDEVTVYYPKTNPADPDITFVKVNGVPSREKIGANTILYVDPDDISNPSNYIYGKAYRDFSSNIDSIKLFLPDSEIDIPIVKISDIPAFSMANGKLWWNKLKGFARAERYSNGPEDPIYFNLVFGNFTLSNLLEIRDGHIQVDFNVAKDGYFGFDTSTKMFGNTFQIIDSTSDNELSISVDEVSADDLWVDWGLDTTGEQIKIDSLYLNGFLDTLKNFEIIVTLEGKNVDFDGSWTTGKSGSFEIDFYQEENIYLDFALGENNPDFDLNGYVELKNDLHFDISWKWDEGNHSNPAYFKINENTNEANLKEINLNFIYKDEWGTNITLYDTGIYVCVEWYWQNGHLYIWPVIKVYGTVDLHLLLNGVWYYNVEDYWP